MKRAFSTLVVSMLFVLTLLPFQAGSIPSATSVSVVNSTYSVPLLSTKPGYEETSEYLIGKVAVGIIFPESNGVFNQSTEDWTLDREAQAVSKIQTGLSWLANQNPNAHVSFSYDIHYGVPTGYEPVSQPMIQYWLSDVMTSLGFPGTHEYDQILSYINSIRVTLSTDWAFAIFVVDSYNDEDGCLPGGTDGAAFGLYVIMTYDLGSQIGPESMDLVTAHETCHIFFATDEYNGRHEYSGYLGTPDSDGVPRNSSIECMMFSSGHRWLCTNTRNQLGWRDVDNDGIQDIVDPIPICTLNPYSPDPTTQTGLTFTGLVYDPPVIR